MNSGETQVLDLGRRNRTRQEVFRRIRRFDEWIEERPERLLPLGALVGIAFIMVGLAVHPYVVAFGILVIVFVVPVGYVRQKLQNWIKSRMKARKWPRSSEENK
jgi:Flp pilus assembly protein TadB